MINKLKFEDFVKNNRNYYIADLDLKKNEHTLMHTHDFYEFFIVLNGEFTEILNDNSKITLSKRQLHVCQPQISHYLISSNTFSNNTLRNIAIKKSYFDQCLMDTGVKNSKRIFRAFELNVFTYSNYKKKTDLLLQYTNNQKTNDYLFKSIVSDVLISGLLELNNNNDIPKWLQFTYEEFNHNKNFIEGLPKLILISGKTQEHLTRSFKRYYGLTPSKYINNLRLNEATRLLRTTDKKLIDIVFDCGFNNISYFNRLFKARYGISPREYRDNNNKLF